MDPELKLFSHTQDEIETCAAAMTDFEDGRSGLYCPVASPRSECAMDLVKTAQDLLWGVL